MNRIEQLQQFLTKNPLDPFLNHALALEYIKLENETEAQKYFEHNLSNSPQYVGTYYHLGKLLERVGNTPEAILIYEKGMHVAKAANDMHAYSELQAVYEDLVY